MGSSARRSLLQHTELMPQHQDLGFQLLSRLEVVAQRADEQEADCPVDEGPIPAIHGVVRWRACDLIMRLYEEFGLSVSDDTSYRALKNLGFSHVSARPKAYKQNAEAVDAFKKTSPSVWRKSARSSHPTYR